MNGRVVFPLPREGKAVGAWVYAAAILIFIAVTRWIFAPHYLYYFDSANFAFSLERFNPALHQPQPPGYPLFVALIRFIHIFVGNPQSVMVIAGILPACAATLLLGKFAADLYGRTAGLLAMALLASNPVFWFGGVTNQVRVFLALSAICVAFLAWRAHSRPADPRWFYAACGALGIASGFRPVESLLLLPLLAWAWFSTGRRSRSLGVGSLILFATALPWPVITAIAVGGPRQYVEMAWGYALQQFSGSSAAFGADSHSAWHMFLEAVAWNLVGAAAWAWALPFVAMPWRDPAFRAKAFFLSCWFLPAFLFSALIHIGDPDQALTSVPVTSLLGSAVLAGLLARKQQRAWIVAAEVVAIHAFCFLNPPFHLAEYSSYPKVATIDQATTSVFSAIDHLRGAGPVTILHFGATVTSRQVSYYYPDDYVVVLPGSPLQPPHPGEVPEYFRGRAPADPPRDLASAIPVHTSRVLCLAPEKTRPSDLPGWKHWGSVFYRDLLPVSGLTLGGFHLAPAVTVASSQASSNQ